MPLMKHLFHLSLASLLIGCSTPTQTTKVTLFNQNHIPSQPAPFLQGNHFPGKVVHAGVLSPDGQHLYITVSNPDYSQFHIYESAWDEGRWVSMHKAPFNSSADDHGLSFSPDGQRIVFSSTRDIHYSPKTWHLWQASRTEEGWTEPRYLEIPNLKDKLLSHPSLLPDGTLIFHASELDYSNMALYRAPLINEDTGEYGEATQITWNDFDSPGGYCTPYVSPSGHYLLFATIGETLDLHLSERQPNGTWGRPVPLPEEINQYGQGNPSLSADGKMLLFTRQVELEGNWMVFHVSTREFLSAEKAVYWE